MTFILVVSIILMLGILVLTVIAISKGYKHEGEKKNGDFDLEQFKQPLEHDYSQPQNGLVTDNQTNAQNSSAKNLTSGVNDRK